MTDTDRDLSANRPDHDQGDTIAAARHDVIAARQRVSGTISEIEARVSGAVNNAKRKVDVVTLARENPWPALGVAFVAGVALGTTGADRKAATATVSAAKRAPDGAKQGASLAGRAASAGLSYLASAALQRMMRSRGDGVPHHTSGYESPTLMSRLADTVTAPVREIGNELRNGVRELPGANGVRDEREPVTT
jgi:ElaB/YqjD/DUF883 family membrane-anchored ribosome-binding protein